MRSAPPTWSVRWEPAMNRPEVAFVLFEAEEFRHVLGETDTLEDTHVLAAREHERLACFRVNPHNSLNHIIIHCLVLGLSLLWLDEVTPNARWVLDVGR